MKAGNNAERERELGDAFFEAGVAVVDGPGVAVVDGPRAAVVDGPGVAAELAADASEPGEISGFLSVMARL